MLLNPELIIPLGLAGSSVGGLWLAGRLANAAFQLPATERRETPAARRSGNQPPRRAGARHSECLALPGSAMRYTNGDYGAAWRVARPATLLAKDSVVDGLYHRLARVLQSAGLPGGTLLQYRFSNHADDTATIFAALERARAETHDERFYEAAQWLAHDALQATAQRLRVTGFRHNNLSLWCRVPVKHPDDGYRRGLLPAWWETCKLRRDKNQGNTELTSARTRALAKSDPLIRRAVAAEDSARQDAEEVFAAVQQFAPGDNDRLNRSQLWQHIYLGHNETMRQVPALPPDLTWDIRDLLAQDEMQYGPDYVLHGDTPVALLSLTVPPQPLTQNGILRSLTHNPLLRFRYTVIVEYLLQDKKQSIKNLARKIFWAQRSPGRNAEGERALRELRSVREELAAPNQALTTLRVCVLVYGPPVRSQEELSRSLKILDDHCAALLGCLKGLPGADAMREGNHELRLLYPGLLPGALTSRPTGLEIDETATTVASFAPLEGGWTGQAQPHTLLENVSGELFGLNLFDPRLNVGVLGLVLGKSGSGKSVFAAKIALDVLARVPEASVVAMDFGETYAPAVQAVGGRQIRLSPDTDKTINVWEYPGLELGQPPDEGLCALVEGFIMLLLGQHENKPDFPLKEALVKAGVKATYAAFTALNGAGQAYRPPILSDFLDTLQNFGWAGANQVHAAEILTLLEQWRGHPRLDAPTSEEFLGASRFDVYELDSLAWLNQGEQNAVAYVLAARMQAGTQPGPAGKYRPRLLLFDEMHNLPERFPGILSALLYGARQGRKTNTWTLLCTHSHHDLKALHGLTANAGLRLIGQLEGDTSTLTAEAGYTPAMQSALRFLNNEGDAHQFLISYGSGENIRAEVVNVQLSPLEYWTFTSAPIERNARTSAQALLAPGEPLLNALAWLADKFPLGLGKMGLTSIPPPLLAELAARQARIMTEDATYAEVTEAAGGMTAGGLTAEEATALRAATENWLDGVTAEEIAQELAGVQELAVHLARQGNYEVPVWMQQLMALEPALPRQEL